MNSPCFRGERYLSPLDHEDPICETRAVVAWCGAKSCVPTFPNVPIAIEVPVTRLNQRAPAVPLIAVMSMVMLPVWAGGTYATSRAPEGLADGRHVVAASRLSASGHHKRFHPAEP